MECEKSSNTQLSLDLELASYAPSKKKQKVNKPLVRLDMSFELLPKQEADSVDSNAEHDQSSLKRRSSSSDPENYQHIHDINNSNKNGSRKKLRLTKEQSALLEDSFKLHSTLNTIQKQSLAEKLNLRPRQVEVWFQNRRARYMSQQGLFKTGGKHEQTKLKQTEVDCEFLKEWCEKLSDENKRLKKELQELHAIKVGPSSLCIQLPKAAMLTMCSSCDKLVNANIEGNINSGSIVCSLGCGPNQE